jgi:hypothetical protein
MRTAFAFDPVEHVRGPQRERMSETWVVRHAPQEVPVADIDGRCVHVYQHLIVLDDRLIDALELQDIR